MTTLRAIAGIAALALVFPACDGTATSPELAASPRHSAASSASPVMETTYTGTLVAVTPASRTERPGGTIVEEFNTYWVTTGDWVGTFTGSNRSIIHRNGGTTDDAYFVFEGTVLGYKGTVEFRFVASFRPDGAFKGRATILGGTGELANLHGTVTIEIVGPGVIEAAARVHFAP